MDSQPAPPEPPPLSDPLRPRIRATLEHWRRRLLDLSKRNRLLNFKPTPVSTVVIVGERPAQAFRRLWIDEKPMRLKAATGHRKSAPAAGETTPVDPVSAEPWAEDVDLALQDRGRAFAPYDGGPLESRQTDDALQTTAPPEQLDRSLRRIADQARLAAEEQGVHTLFLVLGMLAYRESRDSEETFRAPLVLLPVELRRSSARAAYILTAIDDDPLVNPALTEYLRHTRGIVLSEVPDADAMPDDYDLDSWLSAAAERIPDEPGWQVETNMYVCLLSFQKLVMYKDLEQNAARFEKHRLIRQLVSRSGQFVALPEDVRNLDLDDDCPPERTHQVVDADASQLRAIAAVRRGYDLVIEGPPGTGKSQTITNLIAQALAAGKRVLFVAEKMAALEVVHRRLVAAGLGESCLEIHSSKANKRAVMQQIREALDASLLQPPPDEVPAGRLVEVREQLTAYVGAVHEPHGALRMSPFQAYGALGAVLDAPKIRWSGDSTAISADALRQTERELDDLAAAAAAIGDPRSHPWRDTQRTFYSEVDLDEVHDLLAGLGKVLDDVLTTAREVETQLGLPPIRTLADIPLAVAVADLLARSPGAPLDALRSVAWNSPPAEAEGLIRTGRELDALHGRVAERFVPEVLSVEHTEDIAHVERTTKGLRGWFAFLGARYRAIRRRWHGYRLPAYRGSLRDQGADLRLVDQYRQGCAALAEREAAARALFGALWRGEASDWTLLERYVAWVVEFRAACVRHRLEGAAAEHAARGAVDVGRVRVLAGVAADASARLGQLRERVAWPEGYLGDCELSALRDRIRALAEARHLAPSWGAFEAVRARAARGLGRECAQAALNGEVSFGELRRAFRRAFFQRWIGEVVQARPPLHGFQTVPHERRVEEFRALDEAVLRANRTALLRLIRDRVQERLREADAAAGMPAVRRELARQRALSPLRKTMTQAFAAIRAIKPCFLMSPLTVAQLLPAAGPSFDLIIFDEASQLPAEDAAGAVLRGEQLAVVGDPKQLPPTNFFAVMSGLVTAPLGEDGTPVYEDSESVLEEFMAAGVAQSRLKWHYRSTHESLIAFSNVRFYDADLYTFPSVKTDGSRDGLHFEWVPDGVYEGKGLNLVEARRVADAVVEHARTCPDLSLGIGTFNLRQQLAIQDELELRRRQDPTVERLFGRPTEPLFVKNLENIQGDERDVILISVTYAKGGDGRLRYNFGPLNTQNGWRRLNVLITRARRRMRVFASMRGEDINPVATSSEGPRLLREFLLYAEHGRLDRIVLGKAAEAESPFERDVYLELTRRGVKLVPQVGLAGYRIDFGVLDDDVSGRFVCGIECDGVAYHNAETARDRDRLRQQVLEARGWTIHRVWSTDWFKDRNGQIARLLALIDDGRRRAREEAAAVGPERREPEGADRPGGLPAAAAEGVQAGVVLGATRASPSPKLTTDGDDPLEEPSAPTAPSYVRPAAVPYQLAGGAGQYESRDILAESAETLRRAIASVVAIEAPLHRDDLAARVAAMWGVRLGSRIEARIRNAIRQIERAGGLSIRGEFVWPSSGRFEVRSRAGARISTERIPPEEYREATLMVLRVSDGLQRGPLVAEVRAVLGFARTGSTLDAAIAEAIQGLLAEGLIGEGAQGLQLRERPLGPGATSPP